MFRLACSRRSAISGLVPADRDKLKRDLVHAPVKVVPIPNATHFVHLERPEHGRELLLNEIVGFIQGRPANIKHSATQTQEIV